MRILFFEAQNLDSTAVNYLIMNILLSDYFWRLHHPVKSRDMPEVIMLDDAELFLNPQWEKKYNSGIPFIDIMVSRSLEFGMLFIVANQTPRLSYGIKDNAHTWIAFTVGSTYDAREIGARTGLDFNKQDLLYNLGVGQCVVKRIGRKPIVVNVDDLPSRTYVSDQKLGEDNKDFLARKNSTYFLFPLLNCTSTSTYLLTSFVSNSTATSYPLSQTSQPQPTFSFQNSGYQIPSFSFPPFTGLEFNNYL